jgi:hypothetical protein
MATSDDGSSKRGLVPGSKEAKLPVASNSRAGDDPTTNVVASELAGPVGKLVKRELAAEMVGMPLTTFRRRVQNVELAPVMIDGKTFFREVEVVEFAIRCRRERYVEGTGAIPDDLGKLTALVFDLFDQGVAPVEVVKRLEKPAPVIEELHAQWARMRGTVLINGEQIQKLRSLDWTDREPMQITNADRLVRFIQNLHVVYGVDAVNCERCHAARARVCASCYRLQIERIKAETRRYAEEAKTERAHSAFMRAPLPGEGGRASSKKTNEALDKLHEEARELEKRGRRE